MVKRKQQRYEIDTELGRDALAQCFIHLIDTLS